MPTFLATIEVPNQLPQLPTIPTITTFTKEQVTLSTNRVSGVHHQFYIAIASRYKA